MWRWSASVHCLLFKKYIIILQQMRECSKFPSERAKPTSAGAVSSADEWMLKDNARPTLGKHPAVLCMVSSSLTDAVLKQSDIKLPGLLPLFDWNEDDPINSAHRARVRDNPKVAFTLDGVLTRNECQTLITAAEATGGFQPAGIGTGSKPTVSKTIRDSDRVITEDPVLAECIFNRVREYLPICMKGRRLLGLNEQLKVLRYGEGQFFKPHYDGVFARPGTSNRTCLTLQLYLSDDASVKGGATRFLGPISASSDLVAHRDALPPKLRDVDCEPLQGRALVFAHDVLHEGAIVTEGCKYTIRTDVEYGPEEWQNHLREACGLGGSPRQTRLRLARAAVVGVSVMVLAAATCVLA